MIRFKELQQVVDERLAGVLVRSGFTRTGAGAWNRTRGDEMHVIQLLENTGKDSFCVNLGVHYAFLPRAGTETSLDGACIALPDCEIKMRLTERPGLRDQWWPMDVASVEPVAALVSNRGVPILHEYRLDGPITELDGKSIERGELGLLFPMTRVRACLLLGRLHERLGNRDKSAEAAEIGLRLAGAASGPKKALQDLLGRLARR